MTLPKTVPAMPQAEGRGGEGVGAGGGLLGRGVGADQVMEGAVEDGWPGGLALLAPFPVVGAAVVYLSSVSVALSVSQTKRRKPPSLVSLAKMSVLQYGAASP